MSQDPYAADISQRLNARAEDVCRHILPGGKRAAGQWRCGGVDGSPGKSLEVDLEGEHAGRWVDRAGGDDDRGGLVKLWMVARGLSGYRGRRPSGQLMNGTGEAKTVHGHGGE